MQNTAGKWYIKEIRRITSETWKPNRFAEVVSSIPSIKKLTDHLDVDHTDGVGTKGVYHWKNRTFRECAMDAFAMNYNDLVMVGAKPYKTQVHLMIPYHRDDVAFVEDAIRDTMTWLSIYCEKHKVILTGGETAIHDNMEGMEIGMTMTGALTEPFGDQAKEGDILIGLKSSGVHSNGFTLVRKLFDTYQPWMTVPTKLYELLDKQLPVTAVQHITGTGFEKLKRIVKGAKLKKWNVPDVFKEIYGKGVSDEGMYRTFNCGYGMVLAVSPDKVVELLNNLEADEIGVVTGKVIEIDSSFSDKKVAL